MKNTKILTIVGKVENENTNSSRVPHVNSSY